MSYDKEAANYAVKIVTLAVGVVAFFIFALILSVRFPWVGIPALILGGVAILVFVVYQSIKGR